MEPVIKIYIELKINYMYLRKQVKYMSKLI